MDPYIFSQAVTYSQMACCPEWNDKNLLDQVTVQVVLSYPVCLLQQQCFICGKYVSHMRLDICFAAILNM